ncbi:hypothetical protein SLEP1_g46127 [Rubroshorea leprosula]|uniref:Uncharacterized protein n=1 Tax=Rubroshorea leprosula TaxID=152421 RepID=A0AAV5LLW0_9ROSI|nr:hypothetical protein SLEP1_g46127 [Rubroshorea leprosula]
MHRRRLTVGSVALRSGSVCSGSDSNMRRDLAHYRLRQQASH